MIYQQNIDKLEIEIECKSNVLYVMKSISSLNWLVDDEFLAQKLGCMQIFTI